MKDEAAQEKVREILAQYDKEGLMALAQPLGISTSPFSRRGVTEDLISRFLAGEPEKPDFLGQKMLSAIVMFPGLTTHDITTLFSHGHSLVDVISRLSLLETQAIILKDSDTLVPNPLFSAFIGKIATWRSLFRPGDAVPRGILTPEVLRGILALAEGRRRPQIPLSAFPGLTQDDADAALLFFTKTGILRSGAVDHQKASDLFSRGGGYIGAYALSLEAGCSLSCACRIEELLEVTGNLDRVSWHLLLALAVRSAGCPGTAKNAAKAAHRWNIAGGCAQRDGKMILDSDWSVTVPGGQRDDDFLWRFADPVKIDTVAAWALTRESYCRGILGGLTHAEILSYLESQTQGYDASSLDTPLSLAGEQLEEISVYRGFVIKADDRTARIVRGTPELSSHLVKDLGSGFFLMDSDEAVWGHTLSRYIGFTPRLTDTSAQEIVIPPLPAQPPKGLSVPSGGVLMPEREGSVGNGGTGSSAGPFNIQAKIAVIKKALGKKGLFLSVETPGEIRLVEAVSLSKGSDGSALLTARDVATGETRTWLVPTIYRISVRSWPLI